MKRNKNPEKSKIQELEIDSGCMGSLCLAIIRALKLAATASQWRQSSTEVM